MEKLVIDNGRVLHTPPDARFMWQNPLHVIAQGFGSGLSPVAPGTVGTLFAWLVFDVLLSYFPKFLGAPWWILGALCLAFLLGVAACSITGQHLGTSDHGSMVWDEMVAIFIVLVLVPPTWGWQLSAVILFRYFDITKPAPIRAFEHRFKNGFGVMADDLIAAFYTLMVLALFKALVA